MGIWEGLLALELHIKLANDVLTEVTHGQLLQGRGTADQLADMLTRRQSDI